MFFDLTFAAIHYIIEKFKSKNKKDLLHLNNDLSFSYRQEGCFRNKRFFINPFVQFYEHIVDIYSSLIQIQNE